MWTGFFRDRGSFVAGKGVVGTGSSGSDALRDILEELFMFTRLESRTYEMNLEIIGHLEIMHELNYPILLGTSRKSVIGLTLDLPADERVEGTLATTVMGVMKGCSFVRVHDVKENARIIKMTEAILAK